MAIPNYEAIMLPLLKLASNGKEHRVREAIDSLASLFKLSKGEITQTFPSGNAIIFDNNRVQFARLYLTKAGFLEMVGKGCFRITASGLEIVRQNPEALNRKFLRQYPKFNKWMDQIKNKPRSEVEVHEPLTEQTPQESIEFGYQHIRQELAHQLLDQVKKSSPRFFERLVVDLLVKMGYGGSMVDAGKVIGRSGDGGLDGVIKEDRLGLDVVYIQAKKWEGSVGRPQLQGFVGALHGQQANKGVLITTSNFSDEAVDYVSKIGSKIVLINGSQLAELMIDHGVGVSIFASYELKKLDLDYFTED